MGGCDIQVHVALDFTLSNKQRNDPTSLHFIPPTRTNQYTDALFHVLSILQNYDSDKLYPAFGFGAKLPNGRNTRDQSSCSHCFALNGNIFEPECSGVEGVLNAYYNAVGKVEFWGNTQFHHVLKTVNGFVKRHAENQFLQQYNIALIITDGVINDFEDTVEQLIIASSLPVSVIIIGVGDANFTQMEDLDGDVSPLWSEKLQRYIERDIVQFVPFSQVKNDPVVLAKKVLQEVPKQVVEYF